MNPKYTYALLCILLFSYSLVGQDNHYWNDQFGIKATALGGAVVGGQDDYSMVYYNAAAMTLVEKRALSFSINAYQIRTFNQKNALGPGQDLQSKEFSIIPNMLAGILVPKKFKRWHLGYAIISKNVHNSKLNLFNSGKYDALSIPGQENFVSTFAQESRTLEYWAGLSISYDVSPHLSFGLMHMGIFRNVRFYNNYLITVLPQDTSSSQDTRLSSSISFNYWDVKGIFKPSALLHYPKFRVGLAVTLPSFNIVGRGTFFREFSTLNMHDILPYDISIVSKSTRTKVQHKNPTSISIGLSAQLGKKIWVNVTAETFLKQKYYLIHEDPSTAQYYPEFISDSLIISTFGSQKFLSYGESARSVTNVGIGFDIQITEKTGIQFGGHTDFNYNQNQVYRFTKQVVQSSQFDRLVFAIGGNMLFKGGKRASMVFEFGFALPKTSDYSVDFTTPNASRNGLTGDPGPGARSIANSYRLMLELTLGKLLK
jgi:hypothetical protein